VHELIIQKISLRISKVAINCKINSFKNLYFQINSCKNILYYSQSAVSFLSTYLLFLHQLYATEIIEFVDRFCDVYSVNTKEFDPVYFSLI